MKTYTDERVALKVLLNYFRDDVNVSWDNSSKINKLVKKYINGGFDDGFINAALVELKNILHAKTFPKEWFKKEIGDFIVQTENKEFLKLLLETLQTEFKLFQERRDNYCFKDIFKISKETQEFYNSKYKELSCLTQYFTYYYNDIDSIRKLVFEEQPYKIEIIKTELENLLQEKPFPYQWLANSLQRKIIDIQGMNAAEKYYNWTAEILACIKTTQNKK